VESLAEDFKLSACGRQPSLFFLCYLTSFVHFVLFLCVFQVKCLPFKFGGAFSYVVPDLHLPSGIVFFLSHWGQCDILVWGWGRHICHFILFVIKKKKSFCYVVD
jgi:hypothetical protein